MQALRQIFSNPRWTWIGPAAVVLVVALLYAPAIHVPFLFDDFGSIPQNTSIRSLDLRVFSPPRQETVAGRPIVNLTLAINYAIHGTKVEGYHVANIAIYLASVLLLWGIVRRAALRALTQDEGDAPLAARSPDPALVSACSWFAAAATLLWAVHPIQTESATYLIQRTELLKTTFYLLTLYASVRWFDAPSRGWLVCAAIACALGMGAKESMVSAPLMVLVYDYLFVSRTWRQAWRSHRALYLAFLPAWAMLLFIAVGAPRSNSVGFHLGVSSLEYLQTQAGVLVHYLKLTLWPTNLTIAYDWPVQRQFIKAVPAGLAIVGILAATVWLLIRRHWLAAPWVMFFLVLGPTSSFIPIVTEVAAERRMHLPLLAMVLTAAGAIGWLAARRGRDAATVAITITLLLVALSIPMAVATADRLKDYRDDISIWRAAVRVAPESYTAHQNLGVCYLKRSQIDLAIASHIESARVNPRFPNPLASLASIYQHERRDTKRSAELYEAALRLDPRYEPALLNLASLYLDLGRLEDAKALLDRLMSTSPNTPGLRANLGMYLAMKGRFADAIKEFNAELEIEPEAIDTIHNLGMALVDLKRPAEAVAAFERFEKIATRPSTGDNRESAIKSARVREVMPNVQAMLVHLFADAGRMDEASVHLRRLLECESVEPGDLTQISAAMMKRGRTAEALLALQGVVRFASAKNNADAVADAAWGMAMLGRRDEALPALRKAVAMDPARRGFRLFLAWLLATDAASGREQIAEAVEVAESLHRETLDASAQMQATQPSEVRHNPRVETTLAAALARDGKYDAAARLMRDATSLLRRYTSGLPAGQSVPRAVADRLVEMDRLTTMFEASRPLIEAAGSPTGFDIRPSGEAALRPYLHAPAPATSPAR